MMNRLFYLIVLLASLIFIHTANVFHQAEIEEKQNGGTPKETDEMRSRYIVSSIFAYIVATSSYAFFVLSNHIIQTTDILLLFYILIPFLFCIYPKYFPAFKRSNR